MEQRGPERFTIDRNSIVDQVHTALRRAVLRGEFKPGERLIETRLAAELGVSRTPVREALSKLDAEGLVKRLSTGGLVVGDVASEIVEIYGLRQRLEGFAARLAAKRATKEELSQIEAACERGQIAIAKGVLEERAEANRSFHHLIARASHSPRIVRLTTEYYEYSVNEHTLPFHDQELTLRHQEQHAQIVAAIRAGYAARAEQLMYEHIGSVLAVVEQAVRADKARGAAVLDGR